MTFRLKLPLIAAAVAVWLPLLAAPVAAQPGDGLREDHCDVRARGVHAIETIQLADLHVIAQTGGPGRFAPTLPTGTEAIVCLRNDILPQAHDDEVLALGIALILVQSGPHHRLGVLDVNEGHYRYRMMTGGLSAQDHSAIQARFEEYRSRLPDVSS